MLGYFLHGALVIDSCAFDVVLLLALLSTSRAVWEGARLLFDARASVQADCRIILQSVRTWTLAVSPIHVTQDLRVGVHESTGRPAAFLLRDPG